MPATLATGPVSVLARVRYPALANHFCGRALAWTKSGVYVEWEHRGVHQPGSRHPQSSGDGNGQRTAWPTG